MKPKTLLYLAVGGTIVLCISAILGLVIFLLTDNSSSNPSDVSVSDTLTDSSTDTTQDSSPGSSSNNTDNVEVQNTIAGYSVFLPDSLSSSVNIDKYGCMIIDMGNNIDLVIGTDKRDSDTDLYYCYPSGFGIECNPDKFTNSSSTIIVLDENVTFNENAYTCSDSDNEYLDNLSTFHMNAFDTDKATVGFGVMTNQATYDQYLDVRDDVVDILESITLL